MTLRRVCWCVGVGWVQFNRPSLLITDAYAAARVGPSAKERDLADAVMKVLRNDGNVLLPIDTAGRVLELVLHLEQLWGANKLNAYHLVLYNNVAYNTVEFAKSHLEWMNDAITNTFDTHRTNAFATRFLHMCHSREELAALGPAPKLVMASMGSLEVRLHHPRMAVSVSNAVGSAGALLARRCMTHQALAALGFR